MSGYKRVNFYELCRLCATNQQKEKTHIFQEEGRKIQLQNKIQSCLSLKVCENDFLPKVVCSQCLRTLEECYTFRNECVTSETMLSSYFSNFRYTEDFKKSGKVYIKDIAPKIPQTVEPPSVASNDPGYDAPQKNHEQYFTVQIPPAQNEQKAPSTSSSQIKPQAQKSVPSPPIAAYNLNFAALKGAKGDSVGNIAVNANGEIINITPLLDLESILINSSGQKPTRHSNVRVPKRFRNDTSSRSGGDNNIVLDGGNIIQIDLNQTTSDGDVKYEKLPHIKSTNKYTYTIKIEDGSKCPNVNQAAATVVNQIPLSSNNQGSFNQAAYVTSQGNANLNISNSMSSWSFTTPTTQHLSTVALTPTTSNLSSTTVVPPTCITSNVNHANPTTVSQITTNFTTNTAWNVSGTFNPINQNFQASSSNNNNVVGSGKKIRTVTAQQCVPPSPLPPPPPSVKEEQSKLFPCDSCQKVFKRREHLYQHMKLHTGFRPFVCENCNKSFMRKEHLMRHMTSHSGLKNYTCDMCSKSFSRNDNLLKHKKTHDKQTSFTCEICQKQFVMKHYYLAHKVTHENEKCPVVPLWNILKA